MSVPYRPSLNAAQGELRLVARLSFDTGARGRLGRRPSLARNGNSSEVLQVEISMEDRSGLAARLASRPMMNRAQRRTINANPRDC